MAKGYNKWQNPKLLTERQRMDRYLESQGLLNYQTKGMSADEVSRRYANAGVRLRDFGKTGVNAIDNNAQGNTQPNYAPPTAQPQQPIQRPKQAVPYNANEPVFAQSDNGLLVRVKPHTYGTEPTIRAETAMPRPVMKFASAEEVKAGRANWTDVLIEDRKNILKDPNFYKQNKITQYPQFVQQQILSDFNFDWDQLPWWQKTYYEMSSSPAKMGAIQGALMAVGTLNPVAMGVAGVVGGVLGAAAGASEYDQTKEAWQQGDNKFTWDWQQAKDVTKGAFGYLNLLAEFAEKSIGMGAQIANAASDPNRKVIDVLNKESFNAGSIFFETFLPAHQAAREVGKGRLDWTDAAKLIPALFETGVMLDLVRHPEKYKGEELYLGAAMPVELEQSWIERIDAARAEIAKGRNYREVMTEMQTGIKAQIGDMIGQAVIDPLNVMPQAQSVVGRRVAKLAGNKVGEAAFTRTRGVQEAISKYRALVQTQGMAKTIDPSFQVDQLGWMGRQIAGVTSEGKIRAGKFSNMGLLDKPTKLNWLQEMSTLQPGARAELGKNFFFENMSAILSVIDDPEDAARFVRRIAGGDNAVWAEMGLKLADSPEWYTVQPAIKAFAADVLDKRVAEWQAGAPNREPLFQIASILRTEPGKLIDDWAKRGTYQQDFARIVNEARRSESPAARALLADVEAGTFKPETLKQIVDIFDGEGALPWNPGQWRASMLGDMAEHFDTWVSKQLGLKPDSFTTRTAHLLKAAQSILLLGGSPGYALTNGISNMVHRAATGIYGYMTPRQINKWMDRFGATPTRLHEGFGMAGEFSQAGENAVATDKAIRAAQTETKGALAWAQRMLSKAGNMMPFTRLSSAFEKLEGQQGYVIAMKNFWGQTWKRNVGFKEMSPELKAAVKAAGLDPNLMHSAIESGMNIREVESAIFGREKGLRARALVHEAAQMAGKTSAEASDILEKAGVLDSLDDNLRGVDTREKVFAAFDRARRKARNKIDMDAARDMVARAEKISQRLTTEGAKAFVDIATEIEEMGMEKHIQHLERMGIAADSMDMLDPKMRKLTWDSAYEQSTDEYRFFNTLRASTYLGIIKGVGLGDNPLARQFLATMGDTVNTMDNVYRYMREQRSGHFEKWRDDWDNPLQYTERDAIEYNIDKAFKKAFAREDANTLRMADLIGKQYELLFKNAEVGEAARQAYEQIAKFRKEMVTRQQTFRDEQKQARAAGVPLELRQIAAKKFWGETYKFMIYEMAKIKQEAIANLDRIAQGKVDEAERVQLKADIESRAQEKAAAVSAVWDVAEGYWAQGGNFDRSVLGGGKDKHALMRALMDEKYGGFPDLRGLDDGRLKPEVVKSILNLRDVDVQAERVVREAPAKAMEQKKAKIAKDISLLVYIKKMGGLDIAKKAEWAHDAKANTMPGLFTTGGRDISDIVRLVAEEGKYAIDVNRPDDIGGVKQLQELLDRSYQGEKVYPIGHDYTANEKAIKADEAAHIEQQKEDAAVAQLEEIEAREASEMQNAEPFSATDWVDRLNAADDAEKLNIIADMPNDLDPNLQAYASQVFDDVIARQIAEADQEAIAESMTRSQLAVEEQQQTADIAMTRELLEERYRDAFPKASEQEIADWMKVSDSALEWIGKQDGKTKEEMYAKYGDVLKGERGGLMQDDGRIETNNRRMTSEEIEGYARALERTSVQDVLSALRDETRADRIAILDTMHGLSERGARMAESVAMQARGILFQDASHGGAAQKAKRLAAMESIPVDSRSLGGNGNIKSLIANALQRYLSFEKVTNRDSGRVIEFPRSGFNKTVSHKSEGAVNIRVIQNLDGIMRDAIHLFSEPDRKNRPNIEAVHNYAARVKIDGEQVIVNLIVREEGKGKNLYYDNLVILGEDMKAASAILSDIYKTGELGGSNSNSRVLQWLEKVKRENTTLEQFNKGGVQFLDGKAIISAWEGGDISTIVHENGHVFLQMMKDMAERGNVKMLDDLGVFQEWARMEQKAEGGRQIWEAVNGNGRHSITKLDDGTFGYKSPSGETRAFDTFDEAKYVLEHEMFSRGFERYMVDGKAPTPALARVFKNFRNWLYKVYSVITGSAIDVNLTPEMRAFFDKMLGGEGEGIRGEGLGMRYEENLAKIKQGLVEETPKVEPVDNRESRLLNALVEKIEAKDWFAKSRDFESFIKNLGFNLDDEGELNLAYDIMEGAYNMQARKVRAELDSRGAGLQERIEAMDALESNLTEARRTLGKMKLQQFSTPITISEAAGWVADVRAGDTLGEPTAGTANLVDKFFGREDITLKVNEIDAGRQQVLSLIGYEPTGISLMDKDWVIADGKKAGPWATNVITNPPWGAYSTGKYGTPVNVPVKMNDWSQRFTYLTLQRMPDGGRLTGVMPANWLYTLDRKTRAITNKPSEFYKWLKKNYTVQAVIESLPGAYKQRGTDVSSLLVVIDKTSHLLDVPTVEHYGDTQPKTLAEYVKAVESVPKRAQEAVDNAQRQLRPTVAGPDASGIVDPAARLGEAGRPERIGKPSEAGIRPVGIPLDRGERVGLGRDGDGLDGRVAERGTGSAELEGAGGDTRAVVVDGKPANIPAGVERRTYSDAFKARIIAGKAEVKNSRSFAEYLARSPLGEGDVAHPHPNTVVETKGLAGVPYPDLEEAYRPSPSVMRAMNNRALSHEGNIDPVWAAIQQNDKHNMGMLVADDVGMGKSRTGAAFVLDRIEKGKKKILVITKDEQNVLNLMNGEFPHVYNSVADENGAFPRGEAPTDYPAKRIFLRGENFPKVKKGEEAIPTFAEPTVYFVTANEFANFAPKIKELRADVVVVDEAHQFKNSGTDRGQAWTDLHKSWIGDKASMLYLTATPGIDLADLRYLYGLKVWSLDGFDDWVKVITGQESPEQMKRKQTARANVDTWVEKVQAERERIGAKPAKVTNQYGGEYDGWKVGEIGFYKSTEYRNDYYRFEIKDKSYRSPVQTETEAIIVADLVGKRLDALGYEASPNDIQGFIGDAQQAYTETFSPPDRADIKDVGMRDASDILSKAESGKWGKKGLGAFDSTLPPAHTEQIMRELKVAGSYMARDISRAGVDFGVKEYIPPAKAKASFNKRVQLYRRMYDAWSKFGAMNEGAKKAAALFGINGDIQADAKRALFNMRLPGIIDEARASIERGEQAVISIVSVGDSSGESGSLVSAIDKINTKKVEKIGKDTFSDPTEIPEALVEVLTLKEDLKDLESLPSPVDVLRDAFGDRIAFVIGSTSTKDRIQAQQDFQNNKIDLIVISKAGKTGINLHDVTGKKRIHLIVGDYEWSATDFKQELGRVDRTGQVSSPIITVMHTGSAGEKKFVATISNRMKGLGATSKGGAESTGTSALTDTFELGTTLDKIALNAAWQEFKPEWKMAFLDKFFRDPQIPDVPRSTLDTNSQSLSKFLMGLQSIEVETANEIMDAYTAKRAEIMNAGSELDDTAERNTAAQTGDITRQVDLGDNLRMTEVRAADGSKYGIIDGVLTPHMNEVKGVVTAGADVAERYLQGGNAWMRWVQFFDEKKNQYVTGLRVKTSKVKDVAEHFGQILGSGHKPETAMIDLQAGDRIKITGADVAEWELYMGRGGAREDKIVIDKARIKDKDVLMNNGASFSAIGNFFYVAPESLDAFLKRFPIRNDAPAKQPTLYQDAPILPDADPRMPLGGYEQAADVVLHSEVEDEGWSQHVMPLLDKMRDVAIKRLDNKTPEGAMRDMSPEGQEMLRKYMQQVKGDMAGAKLATIRWGENQRDFAMLNYKRRYGFDSQLEKFFPYQFYYTRSMMNWALRALDRPSWFANYARIKRQQNRYERDIPERLRGKIKIPAPWMPDWMGDGLYIDPLKTLFPFANFGRPFEQMTRDSNSQQAEAERVLQEWAQDGRASETEIVEAARTHSGSTWERAFAEAQMRRESAISNPLDFMGMMFGPAWYLTTPLKLLGVKNIPGSPGGRESINPTPILNTTQAIDTVTQNTWAEPFGDVLGLIGKPEQMLREGLGLPEFGEYGEYYIDRQLANMVADGDISAEEAQIAMLERTGANFDLARERVKYELAMRVPLASSMMAGLTADNFGQGVARLAATSVPSLFGAGLLPSGELEYRGLAQEWNEAWKKKDMGDDKAIGKFFDEHPEYEAYLAKNKKPEERLSSFLVSQIWDGYMALGKTDQKTFEAEARGFQEAFRDEETRAPMDVDVETLTRWAQMLSKRVPNVEQTAPAIENPTPPLQKYDPQITQVTDKYFSQRAEKFPNYFTQENEYFNLPKSKRTRYLVEHPELKQYWDWKDTWFETYPQYEPIFRGHVFKRIDTSGWSTMLLDYVGMYAMTGGKLGKGAWKALEQQWLMAGKPYDDVQVWLDAQVVPALLYGGQP
ncbi:MAG: strawberry notch C-terminal domain-containing protein [Chloroflexi bacterium]|nr:strawberry notch C-terminal domain-containing protein [Chloroflexota bacterium]